MNTEWNWKRAIPMWDWHELIFAGYPGWEKPDGEKPASVSETFISGVTKKSIEVASAWDDIGEGQFYWRDFTESGIPFVHDGESYQSIFWFQYERDAVKFAEWVKTQ